MRSGSAPRGSLFWHACRVGRLDVRPAARCRGTFTAAINTGSPICQRLADAFTSNCWCGGSVVRFAGVRCRYSRNDRATGLHSATDGARRGCRALVHCRGLALGGRPAQALASRLLPSVSKDTLLRSIRSGLPPKGGRATTARHRNRRLGLEEGSPLRDHHLRPRATAGHRPSARP